MKRKMDENTLHRLTRIKLEISGNPRTKKNSQIAICMKGEPRLIQSALYRAYEKDALHQLLRYGNQYMPGPVEVRCIYWCQDRRKRDLTNLLAATHDILTKAGIIMDDSMIVSVDGSRIMGVDRENPRVEIRIRQWEDK